MPVGKARLQLGDSWVVEGEDDNSSRSIRQGDPDFIDSASTKYSPQSSPVKSTRNRTSRRKTAKSPEPVFIMPSLDPDTMEASWIGTSGSGKPARASKNSRHADRTQEVRKRVSRNEAAGQQDSSSTSLDEPLNARPPKVIRGSADRTQYSPAEAMFGNLGTLITHLLDIFGKALRILKTPMSYLLAIWLLFGLGIMARNYVTSSIYTSLSPICRIPGASMLELPFCPAPGTKPAEQSHPVEFEQLMNVQSKFDEVLNEAATGVSLPMDMKRSEAAIRDLRQLVKFSQLSSRNVLVLEFDGFIDTARIASYDLQKLNSHVGKAVDVVLATTRWTTQILDDMQTNTASQGAIAAFLRSTFLAPFQSRGFTEQAVMNQYIKHTEIVETELYKLIEEAQALLLVLRNLEDRLDVIHGVVVQDNEHFRAQKDAVLAELWTMIGGNRGKLSKMERQLSLLQHVGEYRQTAYAHVVSTLVRLEAIGVGLEDLRERVGAPGNGMPVPLQVHIETIERGAKKLDECRSKARKLENEYIRSALDQRHDALDGMLIES